MKFEQKCEEILNEVSVDRLKPLGGKYNDEHEITFTMRGDGVYSITNMLNYIRQIGGGGHSFDIVVDPDSSDYRKTFGYDGDGADMISDIKIDGKVAKFKKENK